MGQLARRGASLVRELRPHCRVTESCSAGGLREFLQLGLCVSYLLFGPASLPPGAEGAGCTALRSGVAHPLAPGAVAKARKQVLLPVFSADDQLELKP